MTREFADIVRGLAFTGGLALFAPELRMMSRTRFMVTIRVPDAGGTRPVDVATTERAPRYVTTEHGLRLVARALARLMEHEIMESLALRDGTRPLDPHAR